MVLHLPGESHHMLVSMTQPHSHGRHQQSTQQHDVHQDAHGNNHEHAHKNDPDDFDIDEHGFDHELMLLVATISAESHDESSHEQAKHQQGQADVPSQQLLFAHMPAGNESYRHQSQLTGITHSPPVPPPNA